eukprot:Opistho-2@95579
MAAPRQTPLTCSGHTRPVVDLAFSPITPDGFFIISACKDGKPMLRHGQTGDWIGTFEGHKGAVWCARLNAPATRALTGAADFTAKLWDAVSGNELHTFVHKHIVRTADFSKDGARIVTGSMEKIIRIFDADKTDAEPQLIPNLPSNPRQVLFSADGSLIICATEDKTVRVYDARTLSEVRSLVFDSPVTSIEISRDEKTLTMAHGKTVSFWKADSFDKIKSVDATSPLNSASLHPDNGRFVAGGNDLYLHVFDYESGKETEVYKGHHGPVHCVRYSPDGELYASGSEDGTVRLWQTNVGKEYGLWRMSEGAAEGEAGGD